MSLPSDIRDFHATDSTFNHVGQDQHNHHHHGAYTHAPQTYNGPVGNVGNPVLNMNGDVNNFYAPVQHGDNYYGNINASVVGGRHNTVLMYNGSGAPYNSQGPPSGGYGRRSSS